MRLSLERTTVQKIKKNEEEKKRRKKDKKAKNWRIGPKCGRGKKEKRRVFSLSLSGTKSPHYYIYARVVVVVVKEKKNLLNNVTTETMETLTLRGVLEG